MEAWGWLPGLLLLCRSLDHDREGRLFAGRELHAGGKSPVVLVILGYRSGGAPVGLNQAQGPGCRVPVAFSLSATRSGNLKTALGSASEAAGTSSRKSRLGAAPR